MDAASVLVGLSGGMITGIGGTITLISRRRRKPSLSLELDPNWDGTGPTLKKVGKNECGYLRLLVRNAGGKDVATNVYVELEDIERIDGDTPPGLRGLRGMWLAWADRELTNPRAEKTKESIAAESAMPIDLVHLNAMFPGKLVVDVRPQPVGNPNRVGGGTFSLLLAIHADNADVRRSHIKITYDGVPWEGWARDAGGHLAVEMTRADTIPEIFRR